MCPRVTLLCIPIPRTLRERRGLRHGFARELEDNILALGPDSVAVFVAETVVCATAGAVAPVPGYFRQIREVCERHEVLLILHEVMCGIGRTGTYRAFQQESIEPLITLAKGLGGGYQPIGAVLANRCIADTLNAAGGFQYGFTYVGHPVATAAALALQKVILRDGLVARSAEGGLRLARPF